MLIIKYQQTCGTISKCVTFVPLEYHQKRKRDSCLKKKKNCEKNDWNFWDLGKDINSQWQEVEQTLNSRNSKKITHSYIKIKLLKAKDKTSLKKNDMLHKGE